MDKLKLFALFITVTLVCFIVASPNDIIIINDEPIAIMSKPDEIEEISTSQVYRRMIEPVVIIYTLDEGRPIGSGTAFSIAYDKKTERTYFLTNNHICSTTAYGLPNVSIVGEQAVEDKVTIFYDGTPDMVFQVVSTEPGSDLCLLVTDGYYKPVKVDKKNTKLSQGEKLFVVGAPSSNFPIILEAYFSGYIDRNGLRLLSPYGHPAIMASEIFHPGHSGSPVYNEDGELIGIAFASSVRVHLGPGVTMYSYGGLIISLNDILEFLEKNGIK